MITKLNSNKKKIIDMTNWLNRIINFKQLPLLTACTIYLLVTSLCVTLVALQCNFNISYPIDDAFIYMAISKNLMQYGVWGVDKFAFSPAASTILWPFILGIADLISNFSVVTPLLLNIVFGLLTIVYLNHILLSAKIAAKARTVILLGMILLIPLPILTCVGMETVLHILFTLIFIDLAIQNLTKDKSTNDWRLYTAAFLLGSLRYEGLFTIGIVAFLFAIRKHFKLSALILACGSLPILAYGFYSYSQGCYFLPNSILLKGHMSVFSHNAADKGYFDDNILNGISILGLQLFENQIGIGFLLIASLLITKEFIFKDKFAKITNILIPLVVIDVFLNLLFQIFRPLGSVWILRSLAFLAGMNLTSLIAILIGVSTLYWLIKNRTWTVPNIWLIIFVLNLLSHMLLARVGWFYRYEAYLVCEGLIALSLYLFRHSQIQSQNAERNNKRFSVVLKNNWIIIVMMIIELCARAIPAFPLYLKASIDLYRQQYQVAHFIGKYFPNGTLVINDIGAIGFYNNGIKIVDLVGLATTEVLKARLNGQFNSLFADQIARKSGCDFIAIYDQVLNKVGGIPKTWVKVGTWTDPTSKQGEETVSFYVLGLDKADYAISSLKRFPLPSNVRSVIYNTPI
jgi:hypothetical protein